MRRASHGGYGYGLHDDILGSIPITLAVSYELLKGLTMLGKPVEMYFYPDQDHAQDGPNARLARLQGTVDWYRFRLQDYDRPNPEDSGQYIRWRHLRELRLADTAAVTAAPE